MWQERGVDPCGYTTEESAHDVEALRRTLGCEQINVFGASYCSHLALSVVRRYSRRVGRAAVASVEGPDHTFKLPSTIQTHLYQLGALARADPLVGPRVPDLVGLMEEVHERLSVRPVSVEIEDPESGDCMSIVLGKLDAQLAATGSIGYREPVEKLPSRYLAMAEGDFRGLARRSLALRREPVGNLMPWLMDCTSGASPERVERIRSQARGAVLEDLVDFPFPEICRWLPACDLGPAFRSPIRADVSTLFLSGTLDARTPPEYAREVMRNFTDARHILVENGTHSDILSARGVLDGTVRFLKFEDVKFGSVHESLNFAPPPGP